MPSDNVDNDNNFSAMAILKINNQMQHQMQMQMQMKVRSKHRKLGSLIRNLNPKWNTPTRFSIVT